MKVILAIVIAMVCYMAWNGWKLRLEIGKFFLEYEAYPFKRLFKK